MTKQEATFAAIERIKGQDIKLGTTIACQSDPLTYRLLRYDGIEAVCQIPGQLEKRFPRSEIFDVKKLINVANHLLNVGFWQEGMESTIVTVGEP